MGGESPREGFDCSGFVQHVFARQRVSLPRTSREMAASLQRVAISDLRPGDLLFFNIYGRPHSHVGIYLGKGEFIHAAAGRQTRQVRISSLQRPYWKLRFSGARRPTPTAQVAIAQRTGYEWR
jgi:cell wall-associated NlpC family hydrolase